MFFKKRGGAGQEKKRERKRERVIRFLDEIFKSHDLSNILLEYLKSHLRQLPPDVKNALKDALGVETTRNEAPLAKPKIIPEPPRENTFQEIDDLIFDRIKTIVSQASPDEKFSQGFAEHKLVLDNQEKPLSDVILKDFDFPMVFNLIHRIQNELNESKSFEEEPNPKALFAIKGLMNILTKIEQTTVAVNPHGTTITRERIVGLSHDPAINEFFCNCFRGIENNTLDKDYYNFVVRGIEVCYVNSEERQWRQAE